MDLKILFYLVAINCVICDNGIELSCGADKFSITISDDSWGVNQVKFWVSVAFENGNSSKN